MSCPSCSHFPIRHKASKRELVKVQQSINVMYLIIKNVTVRILDFKDSLKSNSQQNKSSLESLNIELLIMMNTEYEKGMRNSTNIEFTRELLRSLGSRM